MINALGLLEIKGLTAGIEAADAMLKAAQVRLLSRTITRPALITLIIEGDLAACRAALDAGVAAASRIGEVISRKEIGRPDADTEWLVTSLLTPAAPVSQSGQQKQQETRLDSAKGWNEQELLDFMATSAKGYSASEVSAHLSISVVEARQALETSYQQGKLRRRGSRYRIKLQEQS